MPNHNQDIKAVITGNATIEAASTPEESKGPRRFNVAAYNGGPLRLPNFELPVFADLETLKYATSIVAHLDHKRDQRVGHVTEHINDGKTLILAGLASAETQHRDEVVKSDSNGFKWQASIEAAKDVDGKVELVPSGKKAQVNGQTISGPAYIARHFTLTGFSFVSHGADGSTSVTIAATAAGSNPRGSSMKLDSFIEAQGFDPASLTDQQRNSLTALHAAKHPLNAPSLDDVFASAKEDQQRIDAIARLTDSTLRGNPNRVTEIEAMSRVAVADKWTAEKYELEVLRTMRPQAHAPQGGSRGMNAKVLECALAKSCDVQNIEAHYTPETLEASHAQYRNGLGLQELLHITARERGYRGTSVKSDLEDALHFACDKNIKASAGFSTVSLPTILGNVANLIIKEGFNFVEAEWKKICARKTVTNFFEHTSASLTGDMQFEKLGPNGELKHGKVGETTYGNKAETYGKMFALTRTDWINDQVGALSGIRNRIGRGGALSMNHAFWTEFLNNSTFFTEALGNLDVGTDGLFSSSALEIADVLFRSLTDPDGKPLGVAPKKLVVPPAYRIAALKLMSSQQVLTADNTGSDNPWAGMFDVVSSVYMSNSTYTGYSAKKWYLLADPNDMPVIEVALLNGNEMPTVESAAADFDVLGIQFRGYHDFGFRKQEYRGGVAMKGEN
jgi:hypothetical protein